MSHVRGSLQRILKMRQQWEGRGVGNGELGRLICAVIYHLRDQIKVEHVDEDRPGPVNGCGRSKESCGSWVTATQDGAEGCPLYQPISKGLHQISDGIADYQS